MKAGDQEDEEEVKEGWKDISFEDIELGNRIGGGGVGVVYEGWLGNKAVALKTLFDPRVDENLKKEFMDELLIMSKLHHPNIVSIFGACIQPPNLFFVMELCEESLFHLLHQSGASLGLREQLQMALQAAEAMNYLHTRRPAIIHRDLKSHNLLLDADGVVKLCDFGLVRTRHTTAGTPNYMAPELLDGRPFNKSVDVYAFGIVLYEIMTGEIFLEGYDLYDIKRKVLAGERPRPPTVDCPESVQRLMVRCWSGRPESRPEFTDVIEILQDAMTELPEKTSIRQLEEEQEDALDSLMGGRK